MARQELDSRERLGGRNEKQEITPQDDIAEAVEKNKIIFCLGSVRANENGEPEPLGEAIAKKLLDNPFKKKRLLVIGEPGVGKTTVIENLEKVLREVTHKRGVPLHWKVKKWDEMTEEVGVAVTQARPGEVLRVTPEQNLEWVRKLNRDPLFKKNDRNLIQVIEWPGVGSTFPRDRGVTGTMRIAQQYTSGISRLDLTVIAISPDLVVQEIGAAIRDLVTQLGKGNSFVIPDRNLPKRLSDMGVDVGERGKKTLTQFGRKLRRAYFLMASREHIIKMSDEVKDQMREVIEVKERHRRTEGIYVPNGMGLPDFFKGQFAKKVISLELLKIDKENRINNYKERAAFLEAWVERLGIKDNSFVVTNFFQDKLKVPEESIGY